VKMSLSEPTAIIFPLRSAAVLIGESLATIKPAIGCDAVDSPAGVIMMNGIPRACASMSGGMLTLSRK
jgi:hypothetical protein